MDYTQEFDEFNKPTCRLCVHYVDIMCQMTKSKLLYVNAVGARLTEEIDEKMYNYGHLQVVFEDGSIGWYESLDRDK